MKNILIVLLMSCGSVHAAEWWEANNTIGRKIILTLDKCQTQNLKAKWYQMYSSGEAGRTIWGCWTLLNGQIQVLYDNGASYTWEVSEFTYKTDNR
jgi:hypothetical protein